MIVKLSWVINYYYYMHGYMNMYIIIINYTVKSYRYTYIYIDSVQQNHPSG